MKSSGSQVCRALRGSSQRTKRVSTRESNNNSDSTPWPRHMAVDMMSGYDCFTPSAGQKQPCMLPPCGADDSALVAAHWFRCLTAHG